MPERGAAASPPRGRGTRWEWLARLAAEAHGLPRHLSQHSGGMIVATRPLIDCCPIVPAAMEGRQIVQWDKDSCSDAGFLKIDLLGLGMLSAVERAVEMIARTRQERIDLSRIPYDDPATYECIQQADTTGVFQIESRAQMASLRRTRPETLQDITIQVAIVRPGPIQGGAVNPYIERRQRLREEPDYQVPYEHPSLEPVLGETLGTIIFQDQVLEVAIAFAGFSVGEAEGLRRAMSRKRSEAAIEAYHRRFVAGAQRTHGVDAELAERVFAMVQGFSGFGFPKAHGAAFGLLAYQSTWLRVHYGPELLCALLNEQPMGFYPPDALVHEAQRRGIAVLAPEVNHSGVECEIVAAAGDRRPRRDRCGSVSGTSAGCAEQDVRQLVAARERGGRVPLAVRPRLPGRRGVAGARAARLVGRVRRAGGGRAGAGSRRIALWQLGVAAPGRKVPGGTQLALPLDLPSPPALRSLTAWESMLADYGSTGLTVAHASAGAAARAAARRGGVERGPRAAAARSPGAGRGARRRPPAPGHGEGDRVPAPGGRVRDDQPDRPPGGVRAPAADGAHRAADARHRAAGEARRGRRGDQRPGQRRRLDRRPRPAAGRGQGLLAARRAGAARASPRSGGGGARGRSRAARGQAGAESRGLPGRGAGGDELRVRAAAMRRPLPLAR